MEVAGLRQAQCPRCRSSEIEEIAEQRSFMPRGKPVHVSLLRTRCTKCESVFTRASQHDENLRRLAARKAGYGNVLMGEELLAFRKRYGLTQRAASKLFGRGLIAFSRYENESSYPDMPTNKLIRMAILKPDVLRELADEEGVEIPLWRERWEDTHGLRSVRVPTPRSGEEMSAKSHVTKFQFVGADSSAFDSADEAMEAIG